MKRSRKNVRFIPKHLSLARLLKFVAPRTHWLYEPKTGRLEVVPPIDDA